MEKHNGLSRSAGMTDRLIPGVIPGATFESMEDESKAY